MKYKVFILIAFSVFVLLAQSTEAAPDLTPAPGSWASPTILPDGNVGTFYSEDITAGGCTPWWAWWWGWDITPWDGLPAGLSDTETDDTYTISGTPTTAGTEKFYLEYWTSCGAWWTGGYYQITINDVPTLNITTATLPDGASGVFYSTTITAENGTGPYTWAVTGGTPPPGLSFTDGTPTATYSGTPTTANTYTFTVTVTDTATANTASKDYTVDIASVQITTINPLADGMEGQVYNVNITGSGGIGTYNWADSGNLPPGLSLGATGTPATTISGIPTAAGSYNFTITLTDDIGNLAVKDFTIDINMSDLQIDTQLLVPDSGAVCDPFTATITASGGNQPYTWAIAAGLLPPGLSITSEGTPTATISGTPSEADAYTFTVALMDNTDVKRTKVYTITTTGSSTDCVPQLDDYTAYPPFIQLTEVKPNLLVVLDNSGSMHEFAYKDPGKGGSRSNRDDSYVPTVDYYGYFESDSMYSYAADAFIENPAGTWDGNFLNWLTMRRVDVVRKILTGGKVTPRDEGSTNYLRAAEDPDRDYWKESGGQTYRIYAGSTYEQIRVCTDGGSGNCGSGDGDLYNVRINLGNTVPTGVVHDTYDDIRYGLMFFNNNHGGYLSRAIGTTTLDNLVADIQNTDPSTWTPLGETMYEAIRVYQAASSAYNSGTSYAGDDPLEQDCQNNFVLILTDGESTKDRDIPGSNWAETVSDSMGFDVCDYMDSIATNEGYASQCATSANGSDGTYYLEGVSFYAHTSDLRSDIEETQDITVYTVFAFDESTVGKTLLKMAAKYGGFDDFDGDGLPYNDATCGTASPNEYCAEWDSDGDGLPDTYFEAQEGAELKQKLEQALTDILNNMSSGTSATVLAASGTGEGAVYQAYFNPSQMEGATEIKWLGFMHGMLVDKYGNLREDTDNDFRLCYDVDDPSGCTGPDKIIQMFYDEALGKTRIEEYPGTVDSDGNPTGVATIKEFDDLNYLWEAGELLWSIDPDDRTIYTSTDGSDFLTGNFDVSNKALIRPYLGVATEDEAEAIIRYIRGEDDPIVGVTTYDYRPRTTTIGGVSKVWKLGDSVYSTPTVVTKPSENYDLLYSDTTYSTFKKRYRHRRHTVYLGANDGMLHAFNGGFYDSANLEFCTGGDADNDGSINHWGECSADAATYLGKELWSFIPQSLLPHLKWLTDPEYTHVYYVDLQPKVTDVRIFTEEDECSTDLYDSGCIHPGGWGTVLIGGMRYGGRDITYQDSTWVEPWTFRSAYFAIDITDPLNPDLLWSIPNTSAANTSGTPDLGLTTSFPAVARVGDHMGEPGTWYVVFGSGPDAGVNSYKGVSERQAGVYVVNLSTGELAGTFTDPENFSFMSSPITVDFNMDAMTEVAYIGNTYCPGTSTCLSPNWSGKMYRISTNNGDDDVLNWTMSTLYDPGQPITASATASVDSYANPWVLFGTGRYLTADDVDLVGSESWSFFGIKDSCKLWMNPSCTDPIEDEDLFDAANVVVTTEGAVSGAGSIGTFEELKDDIDTTKDGWYVDFTIAGEKSLFKPAVLGGVVMWTTYVADTSDACTNLGNSYLYAVYYKTGTAADEAVIGVEDGTDNVKSKDWLAKGVPSEIGLAATGNSAAKAFIQQSTGTIVQIGETLLVDIQSGFEGFKQTTVPSPFVPAP